MAWFNPPTLQAGCAEGIGPTFVDTSPYSGHAATYLETEGYKLVAPAQAGAQCLCFALLVLRFVWLCSGCCFCAQERAALPGPLCGGEAGTKRPRSGRVHGWARLFDRAGCPAEKPGHASRTRRAGCPESAASGCPFSLVPFSLGTQRERNSGRGSGTKPLRSLRQAHETAFKLATPRTSHSAKKSATTEPPRLSRRLFGLSHAALASAACCR